MSFNHNSEEIAERMSLWVLGALNPTEAREFEEHIESGCDLCDRESQNFQNVVTEIALAVPEKEPSSRIRERLFALIRDESAENSDPVGNALFVTLRASDGSWREVSQGMLAKQLFVDELKGTVTTLFKLMPGAHTPMHRHEGIEQCLILEGDFHLNDDVFGPGDFTAALPGSVHYTAYTETGAMLLIVANVAYQNGI